MTTTKPAVVSTIEKHVQTVLLSIITVAIIGGFNTVQSIREGLVRMEERDKSREASIQVLQKSINELQLDNSQTKNRLTILESQKPQNSIR